MNEKTDRFIKKCLKGKPIDFCLVIDAHGHLGRDARFTPPDISVESVVAAMDRIGIDIHCVSANPGIYGYAYRANAIVEEAIRAYPDRIFGYMLPDDNFPDQIIPEFEKCLRAGFRGIKIWSGTGLPTRRYNHPHYRPAFEFAAANHLPVLMHTWGDELDDLEPIIRQFPSVNMILAHAGSNQFDKYVRFAKEFPNVYLETCFSLSPRGMIEKFVQSGVVDRIVWGSDSTFMGAAQQIGRVLFAEISPEDKEKILGQNARKALNLGSA